MFDLPDPILDAARHRPPLGAAPLPPPPPPPAHPADRSRRPLARRAGAVLALTALGLGAGYAGGRLATDGSSTTGAPQVAVADPVAYRTGGLDVASVVAAVEPSVVSVDTTIRVRQGPFSGRGQGAGTGIVYDAAAGHVVTNAHVVEGASEITVTVAGEERPRPARVLASDPAADLAVLQVADVEGLRAAPLGDGDPQVGDEVVAIGNALALEGGMSVTRGIVSALDRTIDTADGTLRGLVQTDAAISSGNSGGPLVDADGRVIGINTAAATSSGGVNASNIGFAISIGTAVEVVERLLART